MPPIHFIGEPPAATKITDQPAPGGRAGHPFTVRPVSYVNRTNAVMRPRDGRWAIEGTPEAAIPAAATNISYRCDAGDVYGPITMPPAASLPSAGSIGFHNLPIRSIAEIANLDEYRPQLRTIAFLGCTSLVFDDLSWFVPMSAVDAARHRPVNSIFTIQLEGCRLRSLRGMEQFQRIASLQIKDCGVELSSDIGTIEAYRGNHGGAGHPLGDMIIGGNTIGGRTVYKYKSMPTNGTIVYIRQWMTKRGI